MKTPMIEPFLDRLYQAETRNLELEQTLKTINQKIENTGQKDLDTPMGNNKESCDEIILGIREKNHKICII
jgi:transcription termination factor NusB